MLGVGITKTPGSSLSHGRLRVLGFFFVPCILAVPGTGAQNRESSGEV